MHSLFNLNTKSNLFLQYKDGVLLHGSTPNPVGREYVKHQSLLGITVVTVCFKTVFFNRRVTGNSILGFQNLYYKSILAYMGRQIVFYSVLLVCNNQM